MRQRPFGSFFMGSRIRSTSSHSPGFRNMEYLTTKVRQLQNLSQSNQVRARERRESPGKVCTSNSALELVLAIPDTQAG